MWHVGFDIEANGLLDGSTVDYTSIPYRLKPTFKIHCIVADVMVDGKSYIYAFYNGDTIVLDGREHIVEVEEVSYTLKDYTPVKYIHKQMSEFKAFVSAIPEHSVVFGHNIINFDLLATKLYFGIPYSVEDDMSVGANLGCDTWAGKHVVFDDTLVRAKTLNPDRKGGQSLEALAKGGSSEKLEFRYYLPRDDRFKHFAPDMLYYCIGDVRANRQVVWKLDAEQEAFEWGSKWNQAIKLEKAVADLITRQSHRGFKFDTELAVKCVEELDAMMEERRTRIEAILPRKPATKKIRDDSTPPVKQFKQSGELSANTLKWVAKVGGELRDGVFVYQGNEYTFPLPVEPFVTSVAASVDDTTHIKEWLVSLGWEPSEFKEKDLTVDTKKNKLTREKLDAAITRYVEQTMSSQFMRHRCEHVGVKVGTRSNMEVVRQKLTAELNKRADKKYGCKVLTNPSFTVGQEKEVCPNLARLAESSSELSCILDIIEYLTYRHRRSSILGGGAVWDEDEEPEKGYLSQVREDGRIPTPADTCGAATSRMKHRGVANIPRVTSKYGWQMRSLFGVDDKCYQIGYDFDSLEAREEANFCWPFDEDKEYCNSLLLDKPNDVHTKMAQKISAIIGRKFERGPAKSVKYGATYGAQGPKIAKTIGCDVDTGNMIFDAFWEAAAPLACLKESLNAEWSKFDKKRIVGIDGRLVPTRSAHAILNSKFQSSGVICAKRTMVLHDRAMRAENLTVDFFTENWENKTYGQQLIAYHDESQLEVSKRGVEFKRFSCKEEAQAFKDAQLLNGKVWSDIKDSPKGGVFVAYSRVGELAVACVTQAGRDYGMVVDLTAGYMVGNNWAMCH